MDIEIISMRIGEYEVPVPHGLSELLNSARAWGTAKVEDDPSYTRRVEKRDGQIVTILTKRKEVSRK